MRAYGQTFLTVLLLLCLALAGCNRTAGRHGTVYVAESNTRMVSRVSGDKITYFADGAWHEKFWYGIDLGATTPGHQPGEFSPTYDDYRRWLKDISEAGFDSVRVYTILPPCFYQALVDHNHQALRQLWLVQGIWAPDDKLLSKQNAFDTEISSLFRQEIHNAVTAVHGTGSIPAVKGKASGLYTADASPYLLGWLVGCEWDPSTVLSTDQKNPAKAGYKGRYFQTTAGATPFESWLARQLDILAGAENKTGWQHPISFVNWVTTDPLSHPDEPFEVEEMVSVDPMHVTNTQAWEAGYFAAYHVYPYYPDSLRLQKEYLDYVDDRGQHDPYEAYLVALKEHHQGIPLVIAEFGVPSSRGMAHSAPLGRNQGMHTEEEQGRIETALFTAIKNAGAAGGCLFEWHDEWFKFTWNTWNLEIPERRAMWLNRLTNEEQFGILTIEPGNWPKVILDGDAGEWDDISDKQVVSASGLTLVVTSDEAYLYLLLEKDTAWSLEEDSLVIGFDTLPGGNTYKKGLPVKFGSGLEFLMTMHGGRAELEVASAYDQHSYLYSRVRRMIPWVTSWSQEDNGLFFPWKLCLSYRLHLPASQREIPFEEVTVGLLRPGNTNPHSPDYNSLADYCLREGVIEARIPWMMLGYADPSSHQVWAYPYRTGQSKIVFTTSPGIKIEPVLVSSGRSIILPVLDYNWQDWDQPAFHERKKQSYYILKQYLGEQQENNK